MVDFNVNVVTLGFIRFILMMCAFFQFFFEILLNFMVAPGIMVDI